MPALRPYGPAATRCWSVSCNSAANGNKRPLAAKKRPSNNGRQPLCIIFTEPLVHGSAGIATAPRRHGSNTLKRTTMKFSRIAFRVGLLAAALAMASCTVYPTHPGPVPPGHGHRPPHSWQEPPHDPHHRPDHKPGKPDHKPGKHKKPKKHDKKHPPRHDNRTSVTIRF